MYVAIIKRNKFF